MLIVTIAFFVAVLAFAGTVVASTLTANRAMIVRALRMEVRPEWQPAPPAARAPRVKRVVRRRTTPLPEWRAAA